MKIAKTCFVAPMLVLTMLAASSCSDYDIMGPGDWKPADQPDQLGQSYSEDQFIQRTAERSDILFVVDNSCSMIEEQQALMTNFFEFAQFFVDSGLDYHIGVTVLDDANNQPAIGALFGGTRFIDNTTPDPVGAFTGNMTMGGDGSGMCEVGLEATFRALSPVSSGGYSDTVNVDFYREDALLSVIIVSDEPDASTTPMFCSDYIGYGEFIPWFTTLKGSHSLDMIHFAAIVGDQPSGCTSNWGDATAGDGYTNVVSALGQDHATFFSICEHDWTEVMIRLGLEAAGLRTSFHLSQVPVEGTLEVFLDLDGDGPDDEFLIAEDPTYSLNNSYVYNRVTNSLDFSIATMPPEAAILRVVYQVAADS